MNLRITIYFSLFLLINISLFTHSTAEKNRSSCSSTSPNSMVPDTALLYRSQSFYSTRKISGEVPGSEHIFISDMEEWNSFFSVAFAGQKTMQNSTIADTLFGQSPYLKKNCSGDSLNRSYIKIEGSRVADRDPYALRADDLYLSDEFKGILSFNPTVSNFLVDFNLFFGFDELMPGIYCRLYTPFVHTRWNLHAHETVLSSTNKNFSRAMNGGRFSPDFLSQNNILASALDFFSGKTPNNKLNPMQTSVVGNNAEAPYTLIRDSLDYHKIVGSANQNSCCIQTCNTDMTINGFGDTRIECGWNFLQRDDYHAGLYLTGAAPTGNRPSSAFLFSPVIGNSKHWEVGAGLTAHWLLWKSSHENQHIGIYTDIQATHLFKTKESHVFDLKNKPLSRYMLASKHQPIFNGGDNQLSGNVQQATDSNSTPVSFLALGEFTPVANLTAQNVNVSVSAQVDATAWINYTFYGVSMDLGYNLWFSTGKHIDTSALCDSLLASEKTWALSGDAQIFGYFPANNSQGEAGSPSNPSATSASKAVIMAASQSQATLANRQVSSLNYGIDNAHYALANDAIAHDDQKQAKYLVNFENREKTFEAAHQIKLSQPPVFLTPADIAIPKNNSIISHSVFGSIGYTGDYEGMAPYCGLGGQAEFGFAGAVSQWSVWAKFGFSFN